MQGSSGLALVGAFLLAVGASATAQTPRRDGDTWGGHRHQPDRAQVQMQEGAAGIALTPPQATADAAAVDRIYRQLLGPQPPAS